MYALSNSIARPYYLTTYLHFNVPIFSFIVYKLACRIAYGLVHWLVHIINGQLELHTCMSFGVQAFCNCKWNVPSDVLMDLLVFRHCFCLRWFLARHYYILLNLYYLFNFLYIFPYSVPYKAWTNSYGRTLDCCKTYCLWFRCWNFCILGYDVLLP